MVVETIRMTSIGAPHGFLKDQTSFSDRPCGKCTLDTYRIPGRHAGYLRIGVTSAKRSEGAFNLKRRPNITVSHWLGQKEALPG